MNISCLPPFLSHLQRLRVPIKVKPIVPQKSH
jgi:hypothetical protein